MNLPTTKYTYTSLKDIMYKNSSMNLNDITLKNHLLNKAAIAYLRPLSSLSEQDFDNNNKGFLDKCFVCGSGGAISGCFHWFEAFVRLIWGRSMNDEENGDKFE